jgi:hypothetical protein
VSPPAAATKRPDASALNGTGAVREAGLARLHGLLVRVAAGELRRRYAGAWIPGRELDDRAQQAIDETLTEHQRRLFVPVVLNEVPLDALVARLRRPGRRRPGRGPPLPGRGRAPGRLRPVL